MQVETYEVNEVRPECQDDKTALLEMSEKLGLRGQQRLLSDGGDKSTFPYRRMSVVEDRVYRAILPTKEKLEDFENEVIPLRVLQVAAHAKGFAETAHLEVWHNAAMKDPLLVGRKEHWNGENFILARWGEVLESFEVLKKKAREIIVPEFRCAIDEIMSAAKQKQASLESIVDAYLNGANVKVDPNVFW